MFHRANPRKWKLVRISAGSNNRDSTVYGDDFSLFCIIQIHWRQ